MKLNMVNPPCPANEDGSTHEDNDKWRAQNDITDATPRKTCGDYVIYNVMYDEYQHYVIGGTYVYFEQKIQVHAPVLASLTDDGLTTDFAKLQEPLMVIYQSTPDTVRFYPVSYYIQHDSGIENAARIELFDWYWLQPHNCYRRLLSNCPIPGVVVNVSPAARAKIPSILDAPVLEFNLYITNKHTVSAKSDVVDRWIYISNGWDNIKDQDLGWLLHVLYDNVSISDGPIVLNNTILLFIPHYLRTIDIRLVEEIPEDLDQLLTERASIINQPENRARLYEINKLIQNYYHA